MFSKKQRLDTQTFDNVFNSGKRSFSKSFMLKHKDNNFEYSRFAVSIPKKQVKGAVKRHLLKRRFMHALRDVNFDKFKKDFVFILNHNLLSVEYSDIIQELTFLKSKLK